MATKRKIARMVRELLHDRRNPHHHCGCERATDPPQCPRRPIDGEEHERDHHRDRENREITDVRLHDEGERDREHGKCRRLPARDGPRAREREQGREHRQLGVPWRHEVRAREALHEERADPEAGEHRLAATDLRRDQRGGDDRHEVQEKGADEQARRRAPEHAVGNREHVVHGRAGVVPPEPRIGAELEEVTADVADVELDHRGVAGRDVRAPERDTDHRDDEREPDEQQGPAFEEAVPTPARPPAPVRSCGGGRTGARRRGRFVPGRGDTLVAGPDVTAGPAIVYPVMKLANPFSVDWVYPPELRGSGNRLVDDARKLDAEGDYLVLVAPPTAGVANPMLDRMVGELTGARTRCGNFTAIYG